MKPLEKKVHYGHEVKKKFEEHGMSVAEFARRIRCSRNNVYNIFLREFIDMGLLKKISIVLDFDFIHEL